MSDYQGYIDFIKIIPYISLYFEQSVDWKKIQLVCKTWYTDSKVDLKIDWGHENDAPLQYACENGMIDFVDFLLSKPIVNPAALKNRPLQLACQNNHPLIVKRLLEDDSVFVEFSLILDTIRSNHKEIAELLVESRNLLFESSLIVLENIIEHCDYETIFRKFYKDFQNPPKIELLKLSIEKRRVSIAYFLFSLCNENDLTKLQFDKGKFSKFSKKAVLKIDEDRLEKLYEIISKIDGDLVEKNFIQWIIMKNDEKIFRKFHQKLKKEVRYEELIQSCKYGSNFIFHTLLSDFQIDDQKPFIKAVEHGQTDLVEYFLKNVENCDPSANDNYPIRVACSKGYCSIVRLLLKERGVSPYCSENQPLRHAVENNHILVAQILLDDGGARINPAAKNNRALLTAVRNDNLEMSKLLLSTGKCKLNEKIIFEVAKKSIEHFLLLFKHFGEKEFFSNVKKGNYTTFVKEYIFRGLRKEINFQLEKKDIEELSVEINADLSYYCKQKKNNSEKIRIFQNVFREKDIISCVDMENVERIINIFSKNRNIEFLLHVLTLLGSEKKYLSICLLLCKKLTHLIPKTQLESEKEAEMVIVKFVEENEEILEKSFISKIAKWRGNGLFL